MTHIAQTNYAGLLKQVNVLARAQVSPDDPAHSELNAAVAQSHGYTWAHGKSAHDALLLATCQQDLLEFVRLGNLCEWTLKYSQEAAGAIASEFVSFAFCMCVYSFSWLPCGRPATRCVKLRQVDKLPWHRGLWSCRRLSANTAMLPRYQQSCCAVAHLPLEIF